MSGKKRKNQRSATSRVASKRRAQKRQKKRRILLSFLSIFLFSTLLTFVFYLVHDGDEVSGSGSLYAKDSAQKRRSAAKKKNSQKTKTVYKKGMTIVFEEYPEKDDIGFGLKDLIEKTKKRNTNDNNRVSKKEENISSGKRRSVPRLVIIIDDISQQEQIDRIRSLPFSITPSIFPPSKLSGESNRLALKLKHYMVHLPLQSASRKMNSFAKTLYVNSGREKIIERADEIRRLFPSARFINNHTGSVFTSDYKAMSMLYEELRKRGFVFVDSRTTASTKLRKISKDFGDPYVCRDVFIDNIEEEKYILKQLSLAVKISRKKGYAIAIGHPHRATFRALGKASKILEGVKTVYMDELYSELFNND